MKVAKHICFYFNNDRIQYINKILKETDKYCLITDIFIHSNINFSKDLLVPYTNGKINIIHHDLTNNLQFQNNPKCFPYFMRDLIKSQCNEYDVFMYIEDDILVPNEALVYWLNYKDRLLHRNYNLGFFRIEIDDKGNEYTSDNATSPDGKTEQYLRNTINIYDETYVINEDNAYCAFWIYDKQEFNRYINSPYYNNNDGSRETVAFGLHSPYMQWYKGTIVPLQNTKLHKNCRIYHLANNYVHKVGGWKLHLFDEVCKKILNNFNGFQL